MKQESYVLVLIFFLMTSFMVMESHAMDAYDGPAAPPGLYFVDYPLFFTADKLKDSKGNTAVDDLDLKSYMNFFRLSYFNKTTFKNTWAVTVLVPVGRLEILNDHDQGLGDATIALGYWFIDNPDSKIWLAFVQYLDIPIGHFDKDKKANMGSNVWKIRPAILFAKHFFDKIDLEFTAKYNISTENDNTKVKNGNEVILESYFGYFIRPALLFGVHLDATFGEDKEVRRQQISDSGISGYKAGLSLNSVLGTTGINFKYLFDFGVKNFIEGHLFQLRLSWKL